MLVFAIRGLLLLVLFCLSVGTVAADSSDASPVRKRQTQQSGMVVVSIAPAQAEPGTQVVVTLGGIADGVRIFLGGDEIPLQKLDTNRIAFDIPAGRAPGQYVLSIVAGNLIFALGLCFIDYFLYGHKLNFIPLYLVSAFVSIVAMNYINQYSDKSGRGDSFSLVYPVIIYCYLQASLISHHVCLKLGGTD